MRKPSEPSYRLHKSSGQAVTWIHGKYYHLGKHNSQESRQDSNRCKRAQGKRHVSKIVPPPVPPLASSVPPGASELVAIWSALDAHQQAELLRVARSMVDHSDALDA